MAPEVNKGKYGMKCDVWSLGIMLFVMLTGSFPFKGDTEEDKLTKIRVGQYDLSALESMKKDIHGMD
jgi:calcium-dependent protein kinase